VISTKEPVVYVTNVNHLQMNADLPDYNPAPVTKPKKPIRLLEDLQAMASKESLKAARLKNMQSIPGITLPLLNLDLMRKKQRSSHPNVYTKEETSTRRKSLPRPSFRVNSQLAFSTTNFSHREHSPKRLTPTSKGDKLLNSRRDYRDSSRAEESDAESLSH